MLPIHGLLIGQLAFGKSSVVALPIIHDGHLTCVSQVIFFKDSKPIAHLIVCCYQQQNRQVQIIYIYEGALTSFYLKLEQMSTRQF